ncbi:MAG TPA: hypothetical protein VKK81_18430 [Candidatus Binatia bacterium]|nr:hypothetical protein [Candidatus Binatia bacterium]
MDNRKPNARHLLGAGLALWLCYPQVEILMPTKKPCGGDLTRAQQVANQALHQRRLWTEHVNSSAKRCHIVKDRSRVHHPYIPRPWNPT